MSDPKLSIISPVYNGERFIEGCIQSVIDQHCPVVEHIILDGNSTDKTVEIIKRFAGQHPHIRWISEKDNGLSDAMNKGMAISKGKIITFLMVDDFFEPNVLNKIAAIFETLPEPSFVVGNCNVWDDDGKLLRVNRPRKNSIAHWLVGGTINHWPENPSAYFYHKSLHDTIGPYDIEIQDGMDVPFLFKAIEAVPFTYIDETWGNFRLIKGTKTYEFQKSGKDKLLEEEMLKQYLKKFPRWQQIQIRILRATLPRIKYFVLHPLELPSSLLRKIKKLFVKK
ncbi:glycosyltransferase family 2 protein [Candidatus Omnitrophota bacterium]